MDFHDVTLPIVNSLITWPGDPPVVIRKASSISLDNACNVAELSFGSHTGTHIDAPYHFKENGATVDQIPLRYLIGRASVFAVNTEEKIGRDAVASLNLAGVERILFKTKNSPYWNLPEFRKDFVYITKEAAQYLVDCRIKLVGIDYLSVDKFGNERADTHHVFLSNGVVIIEGLDLRRVEPGDYELIALPLRIQGGDGSPARVVLRSMP